MHRHSLAAWAAVLLLSTAGCGIDVAGQLANDAKLQDQLFAVMGENKELAMKAVDRMMSSEKLQAEVVDHLLQNDTAAKVLLARVATNPGALDMVLGMAAQDSVTRTHLITVVKGMEMATSGGR